MDIRDSFKRAIPISELGDLLIPLGDSIMRSKFAMIAAVFVPLGFLGGLSQGSIGLGIGSAIFGESFF